MGRQDDLYGDSARMAAIMAGGGTWALVGLSNNRSRAAYGVAQFLMNRGVRVVPVHPAAQTVHGQVGYPDLESASHAVGRIDVVDLFVRSDLVAPLVADAVTIGASAVWMQLGVIDEAAAARARAAGLLTVMDACPAQEWDRLVPAFRAGAAREARAGRDTGSAVRTSALAPTGDQGDPSPGLTCGWAPPPAVGAS